VTTTAKEVLLIESNEMARPRGDFRAVLGDFAAALRQFEFPGEFEFVERSALNVFVRWSHAHRGLGGTDRNRVNRCLKEILLECSSKRKTELRD
jgi:hypothetical protein